MSIPIFLDQAPARNGVGIVRNSPVFFRIEDPDGLNTSTLDIWLESVPVMVGGTFQPGYSGTITFEDHVPNAVSVIVTQQGLFNYNQLVNVAAKIEDNLGTVGRDYWQFLIVQDPDKTPPLVAASPHGGIFNINPLEVILETNETDTVIRYTLDGSEPDLSSTVYNAPIVLTDEAETIELKFFGVDDSNNYSEVITEEYFIDTVAPTTTANPIGGEYFSSLNVVLEKDDPKATTFFTIDGTLPTTDSTVYTSPIPVVENESKTIRFFSVDKAGNSETPKEEIYEIQRQRNNYRVKNLFVRHAYIRHELELVWEDMHPVFTDIIGYNVYRADRPDTPYKKLNNDLITITQYVDKTLDTEIVEEDVSEQFKRTVNINRDVNDSFVGAKLNETKWVESDLAQLMFQYNGLIFTDKVGLKQSSKITSKFKMQGDFDIQTDYVLFTWSEPVSAIQQCLFRVKRDDNNYIEVGRSRSQTTNGYSSNKITNGNPDLPIITPTIDETGKFRITRESNVITTYFYDRNASDWVQHQVFNSYSEDLYIEFVGISADKSVETRWLEFKVNSGRPVIIEPRNQLLEYVIGVSRAPIVDSSGTNKPTDDVNEVQVTINGQRAYVKRVEGLEGCIYLETDKVYDPVRKEYFMPPVPDENSIVLITYKTKLHTTNIDLRKTYYYKVTCVTEDDETDLDVLEPETLKPEKYTYIYKEAIRRNAWLRDQGGERVMLYLKKRAGEVCPCMKKALKQRTHVKADKDCDICYGVGFVGGYDGPYNIIIGNLTSEQRINQTERGLKLQYQVETWTGPFPIITQRDMIIRRNGDRVLVGPVTPVDGPGGVTVQQHFTIEVMDATDVRYTFPIQPLPNQFQHPGIDKPGYKTPEIHSPKEREELETNWDTKAEETDLKSNKHRSNKQVDAVIRGNDPKRGRSIKFENTNFIILLSSILIERLSEWLNVL